MTDNQPLDTAVNYEIKETVDSDKSFESCLNSVNDGINNNIKDDESEKSFISCSINNQDKSKVNDLINVDEPSQDHRTEENTDDDDDDDDDDDNIRPGSCRENASSDDDVSSWDENNDQWIYDTEYIQQSGNNKDQIKTELTNKEIKSCEKDLEYIIENHVSKENLKDSSSIKYKNNQDNPTFIPTNGKFFMHDLRLEDTVNETTKHNKNSKNLKNEKVDRWSHDLYDEAKQKPISKLELIQKYGEDIRSKTNDQENNKNKPKKKSKRNNYKRKNYRYQQAYYDYDDYYDNYNQHYYNNDYYFDYSYYGNQYNSWGRSNKIPYNNSRENNRDIQHLQYDSRSYKSNSLPTSNKKIKQQKPPNKYSQIAEFTDIKITVDNIGARQIKSLHNSSIKSSTKVLENSMFRRSSDSSSQQCPVNSTIKNQDYSESYKDTSFHKKQPESLRGNKKVIGHHEIIKNNLNPKFQGDFNSQRVKSSNKVESSKNFYEKNHGDYSQFNRHKLVPEWVNSKLEWDENKDLKNTFEEMPPLTDKEINQLQKRSFHAHIAPPRFSRDKSVNISNEAKGQNRVQPMSHVPKRYSEVRNQFETPKVVPNESTPAAMVTNSSEMINYQQIIPNMDYYGNLQPLLLNLNQGPAHSASNNSPQQSIQQMMSLPSLLQTGGYNDNPQFYIQSVYLPPNGRLNQYSQPFQPSYVPQSQNTMFKMPTSASSSNNTSNIQSQNSRPVTGKS